MMLNKKSLALLSALLVTSNATADLRTKSGNEQEISNVIHSMDDIGAIVKKIPMNSIRELNSETCENETSDIMMNPYIEASIRVVVEDIEASARVGDFSASSYCSCSRWSSQTGLEVKVFCDCKDAYLTPDNIMSDSLETACDLAGGQLFQYSVTVKGEGYSIFYKNMATCIGTSCTNTTATIEAQEDMYSFFNAYTCLGEATVEESGASTLWSDSEICEIETFDLMMNLGVRDAMAAVNVDDYATSSYCSGSQTKLSCDYKDAYSGLETACDTAGGELFQYSVTMKGEGGSISFKNMASCIGASCDTAAAIEAQEENYSFFSLGGYEVTVEESGASTLSAAALAMIALAGAVATLI